MITVLTFYSPGGLLIKAIGFPTILGKTDTKTKREVMSKIYSFKRMFPNYSFTVLGRHGGSPFTSCYPREATHALLAAAHLASRDSAFWTATTARSATRNALFA